MITGDITSSNAIVLLGVANLYPQAQQLQGFGADEAFNADDVEPAEIVMGVDATVSGGFVPVLFPWNCTLMPGQGSDEIFENWYTAQLTSKQLLKAFGSVTILATGREYTMTGGFLSRYKPMPEARKVLQARQFRITWSSILPAVGPTP